MSEILHKKKGTDYQVRDVNNVFMRRRKWYRVRRTAELLWRTSERKVGRVKNLRAWEVFGTLSADLMYSKPQNKTLQYDLARSLLLKTNSHPNSFGSGCHLPGAMCMEVWGTGVGGGGQRLVVAGAGWGGEDRGRWGGGGAGPWSVQAGGKTNNNSPHVRTTPTYRVEEGMGEVVKQTG